jgi:hypothetical protein
MLGRKVVDVFQCHELGERIPSRRIVHAAPEFLVGFGVLELMIDSPAQDWGVHIDRVEIKDVVLPESMKRSMSRQAEAERERRSRVIAADGELQASAKLAQAAEAMAAHPAALQLRPLQTVVEVASEKNSTLVLPFPVELLRFLERATPRDDDQPVGRAATAVATVPEPAVSTSNGQSAPFTPHILDVGDADRAVPVLGRPAQ